MPRQKEKAPPNIALVYVAAVGSIILGLFLGSYNLLNLPVEEVSQLPEEEEYDYKKVYFVKGGERGGSGYRAKREAFLRGAPSVRLNEAELNLWARNFLKPDVRQNIDNRIRPIGMEIHLAPPNFRIADDKLQIASYVDIPAISKSKKFVFQVEGTFRNGTEGPVFVPDEMKLGRLPFPDGSGVPQNLVAMLQEAFSPHTETQEVANGWGSITSIEIEGDTLVITRG